MQKVSRNEAEHLISEPAQHNPKQFAWKLGNKPVRKADFGHEFAANAGTNSDIEATSSADGSLRT
jgi:hypothetical protein